MFSHWLRCHDERFARASCEGTVVEKLGQGKRNTRDRTVLFSTLDPVCVPVLLNMYT